MHATNQKMDQSETQAVIKFLQKKGMTPKETHADMVQTLAEDFLFICNCEEVGCRIQARQRQHKRWPSVRSSKNLISNRLELYWQLHWPPGRQTQLPQLPSSLRYIIVQRLYDRPLDLWNRMFNRHQAEITVMPMHKNLRKPWEN